MDEKLRNSVEVEGLSFVENLSTCPQLPVNNFGECVGNLAFGIRVDYLMDCS